MISIIPLTYLFVLSTMLTPIAIFLLIQVINFNKKQIYLSETLISPNKTDNNFENQYQIANIYIDRKSWYLALIALENEVYANIAMNEYWLAKYHNAIGFTLEQIDAKILSQKHYILSSTLYPDYVYAANNLKKLTSSQKL